MMAQDETEVNDDISMGGTADLFTITEKSGIGVLTGTVDGAAYGEPTSDLKDPGNGGFEFTMMHYFLDKDGSRLHTHEQAVMHPDPKGEGSTLEVEYPVVQASGRFAGYGGTFRSRGWVKAIDGESAPDQHSVGVVRFEGAIRRKYRRGAARGVAATMKLITHKDITVPVTVQTRTVLPPDRAFQPAVDLSLVFKGWGPFPAVREVRNQTGAWDHAGVSRNPILSDGSMAAERLTEHTPGHSFAYEVTGFTNLVLRRLVSGVRGEWTYTLDSNGTVIRWTYEFKPLRRRYWLVRHMLAPLWRHYMQAGIEAAARVAEDDDGSYAKRV